jgi:hypothetical protein
VLVSRILKPRQAFEELLQIQASLIVPRDYYMGLTSADEGGDGGGGSQGMSHAQKEAFVHQLASPDRKLLLQGDLIKICKKKDLLYRFWLFNDFLIYAAAQVRFFWS